jgi:hypothetical protein
VIDPDEMVEISIFDPLACWNRSAFVDRLIVLTFVPLALINVPVLNRNCDVDNLITLR